MKRKTILAFILLSFVFAGVASAAALWGAYKGSPIVRVKVDGAVYKNAVPAISFNNQTYVPLNVLDKAGVKYAQDKKNQTLELNSNGLNKAVKQLYSVTLTDKDAGIEASTSFYQIEANEDEDWDDILDSFDKLLKVDAATLKVDYYTTPSYEWKGSIAVSKSIYVKYKQGKITDDQLSNAWVVEGKLFRAPLTAKEIAKLQNAVGYVMVYDENGKSLGQGSGFVINENTFLTNYHVAGEASKITVTVDKKTYDLSDWYYFKDEAKDIFAAAISTAFDDKGNATGSSPEHYLDYTTALPEVGDKVYAIGSPNGLENTVSDGIVSSIRTIDGVTYIQHTADTEVGSSGGVLLNEYGEVIGITTFGVSNTTLDFAVPMKYFQSNWDNL
ncbi:S1C family serine protease [Cohnella herbarum]|uniref:Trypsin-like peptidase domain-containing protein n=1 Tax=Cohnella herbarum TaxID=2728023 RepID=A0A7Z2VLP4_9BACL|nr:S1C family serine protease [Cohnella herbarum]QJD85336.1 trypsin-like peptidase domain-containing protein [Cohnella herbarum]